MPGRHAILRLVEISQTNAIPGGFFASQILPPFDFGQTDGSRPLFVSDE
jgi:hypothetical protein